jgi:hypothetical protein
MLLPNAGQYMNTTSATAPPAKILTQGIAQPYGGDFLYWTATRNIIGSRA